MPTPAPAAIDMHADTPAAYLAREARAMDLRRMAAEVGTDTPRADREARLDLVWEQQMARHYGPRLPMGLRIPG